MNLSSILKLLLSLLLLSSPYRAYLALHGQLYGRNSRRTKFTVIYAGMLIFYPAHDVSGCVPNLLWLHPKIHWNYCVVFVLWSHQFLLPPENEILNQVSFYCRLDFIWTPIVLELVWAIPAEYELIRSSRECFSSNIILLTPTCPDFLATAGWYEPYRSHITLP